MYICWNSPLYISKLTEIAQSVKTLYRVEEEERNRDLEGLTATFLYSSNEREAHNENPPDKPHLLYLHGNVLPVAVQCRRHQSQVMLEEKSCPVLPMTHKQAAWTPPRQRQGWLVPLTVIALSVTLPFSSTQHFQPNLFLWKIWLE